MSSLKDLHKFGQSPWYDNIERGLLLSGGLKKMVDEDGIAGVTSNPSIFEKAINGSQTYDTDIQKFSQQGESVFGIYDELTTTDVSTAADILANVHQTSKIDGYVSIEVSPHLAHETEKTVEEARRLFAKINKQNIMIKIPATKEGPAAIRQCIADGISVNVTLIFNLRHYRAITQAYIEGIKERIGKGLPVDNINSVASFFVSRIDTYVDKLLDAAISKEKDSAKRAELQSLLGQAAVAQSKVMYAEFRKLFFGQEFAKLRKKGANVQRFLLASTSTKNPKFSDIKYIEELIGEGTINTIPQVTVDAFRDHGAAKSTLDEGLEEAKQVLTKLKGFGIDVESVCQQIQDDGVQAFIDSYDKLIDSLENKRKKFIS
ncbi:MAG: transaldolase [Candidatus Margulisbacteria bacterium]|nr:transaldolase [Candidatus Margulisiibacteriota bacterium]